jgi:hypothetical protein
MGMSRGSRDAGSLAVRSAVLVAMLGAMSLRSGAPALAADCAPGDSTCCTADAACDDGDACTADACVPEIGCLHDPIGFDAVRNDIAAARRAAACAPEGAPRAVATLLAQAAPLVDRASTRPSRRARRLVRAALARLRRAERRASAAASRGTTCATELATAVGVARSGAVCLQASLRPGAHGPAAGVFACLQGRGQLVRLSGMHAAAYDDRTLAPDTRIDARAATFLASLSNHYPISIDGGAGVCLAGGTVRGQYDRSLSWATMHDMNNAGVAFANPTTVDGIRIDDVTDGIRPRGQGPFTVRNAWLSYVRDDCLENDHVEGGVVEDSLFDGCYVAISERPSPSIVSGGVGGSADVLTIQRSLIRLAPMPGPRGGADADLGNGQFFKWSDGATRLALVGNVFMAEQVSQEGGDTMGIPAGLTSCANNVMVWLGPGSYPAPLPACFRVTHDRGIWDAAVADWKRRHPGVGP